jgi:hypothetical protein
MIHGTVPDSLVRFVRRSGGPPRRAIDTKDLERVRSLYLRRRRAFSQPHRSMRLKKIAVIIQHNARDLDTLPAFRASTK